MLLDYYHCLPEDFTYPGSIVSLRRKTLTIVLIILRRFRCLKKNGMSTAKSERLCDVLFRIKGAKPVHELLPYSSRKCYTVSQSEDCLVI